MSDQHSAGEQESGTEYLETCLENLYQSNDCCLLLENLEHDPQCDNAKNIIKARAELAALTAATAEAKLAGQRQQLQTDCGRIDCWAEGTGATIAGVLENPAVDPMAKQLAAATLKLLERAKLTGELAGREAAAAIREKQHAINCGLLHGHIGVCTCSAKGDAETIRALPLTPDSAGVLERIKRAERASGAEEAYRYCALCTPHGYWSNQFARLAAEQAAIADGKGDEDGS